MTRVERQTEALLQRLADADRVIGSNDVSKMDLVLVVGNTGSGKSTFINYMLGKRMMAVEDNDTGDIRIDCEDAVARIGHGFTSETYLPEVFSDPSSKLTFCDCPGFGDNRGVDADIANMYSIAQLANSARSVKAVVFLVSFHALQDHRAQSLTGAVSLLSAIFGEENWSKPAVQSNVLLLVTGAEDRRTQRQLRQILLNIAAEREGAIPVALAERAEAYDPLDASPVSSRRLRRADIVQLLQSYPGMPAAQVWAFTLSAEAVLRLSDLMSALEVKVQSQFQRQHFRDVQDNLDLMQRLEVLNCPRISDKIDALFDSLRTGRQVGDTAASAA